MVLVAGSSVMVVSGAGFDLDADGLLHVANMRHDLSRASAPGLKHGVLRNRPEVFCHRPGRSERGAISRRIERFTLEFERVRQRSSWRIRGQAQARHVSRLNQHLGTCRQGAGPGHDAPRLGHGGGEESCGRVNRANVPLYCPGDVDRYLIATTVKAFDGKLLLFP